MDDRIDSFLYREHIAFEGHCLRLHGSMDRNLFLSESAKITMVKQTCMIEKELLKETRHKERSSRRIIAGRHKRQALRKNETNIWTSKIKNYYFDSLEEKRKKTMEGFLRAAKAWEKDTCVKFEELKNRRGDTSGMDCCYYSGSPTKNPKITPKEENYEQTIGSPMISFIDLRMVNKLYDCDEIADYLSVFIRLHFIEPPIVTGTFGLACGGELNATNTWKEQDLAFASANNDGKYSICTYWIRAPAGNRIEMKIDAINGVSALQGCVEGGIEIKTNEDQRVTGHRFCSLDEEEEITLKSTRTLIPAILYSNVMFPVIFVKIEYRYEVDEKLAADQKF
ncbi:astacin [Necator americanus]|uniref:Astacin n=1 Tax=Necator americanus TaxID=51031 RepID=W2T042_NECAM|nr:astacin [Necator americanus]ETN74327.1 astacin [Necator americanus]